MVGSRVQARIGAYIQEEPPQANDAKCGFATIRQLIKEITSRITGSGERLVIRSEDARCVFGQPVSIILRDISALRRVLPEHHLSKETQDVVRLGTGLTATIAALVLGLLGADGRDKPPLFDRLRARENNYEPFTTSSESEKVYLAILGVIAAGRCPVLFCHRARTARLREVPAGVR